MIEAIVAPLKPLVLNKVTAPEAPQQRLKQIQWDEVVEGPEVKLCDSIWLQPLPEIEFDRDQVAQLFEVRSRPEAHLPVRAGR